MLLSVVAPSDGGGAMGLSLSLAGEPLPAPEVPVASADEVVAVTLGDVSEPAMSCGAVVLTRGLASAVVVVGALALTTNVGAAASVVGKAALVVVVAWADVITAVVVAVEVPVVVADETVVVRAGAFAVDGSGAPP